VDSEIGQWFNYSYSSSIQDILKHIKFLKSFYDFFLSFVFSDAVSNFKE